MTRTNGDQVLIYAQHLSGVGHYVRTHEIARALSARFRVHWVEGGRPVPHRPCPELIPIELPRIQRGDDGGLQSLDRNQPIEAIQLERSRRLVDAVDAIKPRIFLVEYFPFSKWELAVELQPAIERARSYGCRVVCSLRDIVQQTRFEDCAEEHYSQQVLGWLHQFFDVVLVHADPDLVQLQDTFAAASSIQIPLHYTGLVSERYVRDPALEAHIAARVDGRAFVLLSTGGSRGGKSLVDSALELWRDSKIRRDRLLVICGGLDTSEKTASGQPTDRPHDDVIRLPFQAHFLPWLTAADLSISQCGYNTAANLLETECKAIVWPHPMMSDQDLRAQRMAQRGLLDLVETPRDAKALMRAMACSDQREAKPHRIDLNGASRTAQILLDQLVG